MGVDGDGEEHLSLGGEGLILVWLGGFDLGAEWVAVDAVADVDVPRLVGEGDRGCSAGVEEALAFCLPVGVGAVFEFLEDVFDGGLLFGGDGGVGDFVATGGGADVWVGVGDGAGELFVHLAAEFLGEGAFEVGQDPEGAAGHHDGFEGLVAAEFVPVEVFCFLEGSVEEVVGDVSEFVFGGVGEFVVSHEVEVFLSVVRHVWLFPGAG